MNQSFKLFVMEVWSKQRGVELYCDGVSVSSKLGDVLET